jgi:preprotein translocase subunit SecA
LAFQHDAAPSLEPEPSEPDEAPPQTYTREQPKVGRNEPCPCGSGKKYKQCHGKL